MQQLESLILLPANDCKLSATLLGNGMQAAWHAPGRGVEGACGSALAACLDLEANKPGPPLNCGISSYATTAARCALSGPEPAPPLNPRLPRVPFSLPQLLTDL